ncbi:sulfur oxidation c-type cytochrome SoxX [Pseudovibrio sp. Tun.PSC04-5.I4]|uniref:sulfur oxidation c-type cytochrome SoxX n=1 Tax=Pseudovibrio sp. Tun.PSC04-5.I4 TaxID=1798213 RepID=UPI00088AE00D|nr:sulfur oxidation c-type cytochrome SoxX [Pseudovibrio sp. Tun.PSC04-5.I4]SDQ75960.1 monoheme cytochrome SoxX (sulfur oxidation) [Pseudovibrio sp. Tun.PSC04-5.I4]
MKAIAKTTVAAMLLFSGSAFAGVIAPDDVQFVEATVSTSLTGQAGDPAKGRDWFANRKLGNCLACHANSNLSEEQFHGEIGPYLDGVASTYSEAELRAIVINSKAVFGEETIMPAFYRVSGLSRVAKKFKGKPILSAEQVEDIVAYLATLKE